MSVHESGEWGPACYIATDIRGQTLAAWLFHRSEPVPPALAAALVASLARALDFAHDHGIIHRDLKPSNVMLVPKAGGDTLAPSRPINSNSSPRSPISDWRNWKRTPTTRQRGRCRHAGLHGTRAGRAKSRRSQPADRRVCAGRDLVRNDGRPASLCRHKRRRDAAALALDEPTPPRRLRRGLPRDLEAICLKCLEKTPAARYATAAVLADDLTRFLTKQPTRARPLGPMHRSLKWVRRRPAVAALLAIIVLTGVAELANYWWQAATLREALAVNRWIRRQAEDERRAARIRPDECGASTTSRT